MAKTALEVAQPLLKANPGARPIARRDRGPKAQHEQPDLVPRQPGFGRHRRKCRICRHPHRYDIEQEFLRWRSSVEIAQAYGLADHSSVCRHARAIGLYDQRRRTLRFALEPILEQAELVALKTSPSTLITAARAYSQINDDGVRHRRPPNLVYHVTMDEYKKIAQPNRQIQELEDDPTH